LKCTFKLRFILKQIKCMMKISMVLGMGLFLLAKSIDI
jgi:hypothetical protein